MTEELSKRCAQLALHIGNIDQYSLTMYMLFIFYWHILQGWLSLANKVAKNT